MFSRAAIIFSLFALSAGAASFSGASALEFTRRATAFGPRPSGSAAINRLRAYIEAQAKTHGWEVTEDSFTAETTKGPVVMKNIVAHLSAHSSNALVFTGHYDTKVLPGFVGANDGGSSTGLLLELARVLPSEERKTDIFLVWFDGEEAVKQWTDTDSLYGSRHLAKQWAANGTLARIRALINVDMVGDADLDIFHDENSYAPLMSTIWQAAENLGYGKYFRNDRSAMEDDHMPFVHAGVPAVDIIDFHYGPNNSYWHSAKDTLDKLSAHSFEVVGSVLMEVKRKLD